MSGPSEAVEFLRILAPIFGPVLVALIRRFLLPNLPKAALPIAATVISATAGGLLGAPEFSGMDGGQWAATAGGMGVTLRELGDSSLKTARAVARGEDVPRANA